MSPANQSPNKPLVNRTEILRVVVADAESIGIRDRNKIEQLTAQVIERLEQPQTLPGMEHLVPKPHRRQKRLPSDAEIQAMVKEILMAEKPAKREEVQPQMESTTVVKPKVQFPLVN
ncbi:unnamed protein product [marine sediment metagenome]|uniref:Uncharacterized protein n=2 Tax=marine sediment metagenome TaxID=412755 RepID=X1NUV9_9ZZZZ